MITPRRSAPTVDQMSAQEYGLYLRSCGFTWESIRDMLEQRFGRRFTLPEMEAWSKKPPDNDDPGDQFYGMFWD